MHSYDGRRFHEDIQLKDQMLGHRIFKYIFLYLIETSFIHLLLKGIKIW